MFRPTILVDFDETITPVYGYSKPPSESVLISLRQLKEKYKIVIYSTRANKNVFSPTEYLSLEDYLIKYDIPYDEICTRKPVFFALIDDRCFNPKIQSWDEITKTLLDNAP